MTRIPTAFTSFSAFCLLCGSFCTAKGPWDLDSYVAAPEYEWVDDSGPIRSFLFESEPFQGRPTEVFGFYATPGTLRGDTSKDKNLPAVVLLHGGGGTAFAEWVKIWADRGYAAIAIDLCGNRPADPAIDAKTGELSGSLREQPKSRKRLKRGGPPEGADSKFKSVGGDVTDGNISAKIPAEANAWLFTVTDSRDAMVSTEVVFAE